MQLSFGAGAAIRVCLGPTLVFAVLSIVDAVNLSSCLLSSVTDALRVHRQDLQMENSMSGSSVNMNHPACTLVQGEAAENDEFVDVEAISEDRQNVQPRLEVLQDEGEEEEEDGEEDGSLDYAPVSLLWGPVRGNPTQQPIPGLRLHANRVRIPPTRSYSSEPLPADLPWTLPWEPLQGDPNRDPIPGMRLPVHRCRIPPTRLWETRK